MQGKREPLRQRHNPLTEPDRELKVFSAWPHRLRLRLSIALDIRPRTPTITARNSRFDNVSALVYHTSAALVVFCTRSAGASVALLYVPVAVAVAVVVPVNVAVVVPVTVTVGRVVIGRVTVGVGAICTRR